MENGKEGVMTINLKMPEITELKPRLMVFGVGGAGGNAVNNMITSGLQGVDFIVGNTDSQALITSQATRLVQMGVSVTEGLGAGSHPEIGCAAAEETIDEIRDHLSGAHMVFITAGMGGGTGTGAAPVIARVAKEMGILTVGVVTKPFHFEGIKRMRTADAGIIELQKHVDTLIVIPNQNLFRVANEKTTFADAFSMADQVLYSGVACITDLMVKEGLINLDFADVRSVMRGMGKAMMGTGEASGENRAMRAAEAAISNPLLDDVEMQGAKGLLISITGGRDMTLYELDEAATRIREEVDQEANIIVGATYDDSLEGLIRVSVVATGIEAAAHKASEPFSALESSQRARHSVSLARASAATEEASKNAAPSVVEPQKPLAEPVPSLIDPDVLIRSTTPAKPALRDQQPVQENQESLLPAQASFIPLEPVRPEAHTPRMPRIDELPVVAQRQIEASRQEGVQKPHLEEKRAGLRDRLAALGFGKRNENEGVSNAEREEPEFTLPRVAAPPIARPNPGAITEQRRLAPENATRRVAEYDTHNRPAQRAQEDDYLEIPAFLRRNNS
jgi:cell division protein FtsZ